MRTLLLISVCYTAAGGCGGDTGVDHHHCDGEMMVIVAARDVVRAVGRYLVAMGWLGMA
jgi:hypothetical protein